VEHAVVLCRGGSLGLRDLPASVRGGPGVTAPPARFLERSDLTVREAEKQLIMRALREAAGNRTEAARKIGVSRRTLHRKLHEYDLTGF
jgi:DNA-binding NtrC family response regulator